MSLGILTTENLQNAINLAATRQISHEELVKWCSICIQKAYKEDTYEELSTIHTLAEEIDAQWDLFLSNTFTLAELQTLNKAEIEMPAEWLEEWTRKLED